MSNSLLLDTLFGVIALLFIPIGLRRGATREAVTTAAILAGAQLSASWAKPWGADLAAELPLRTTVGQFTVSTLFLIGVTLMLGFGGAAALKLPESRLWGRLAGALLAVINGSLITAFLLRDIERFLTDPGTERALEQSRIARILLRDFGWVMLGAVLAASIPVFVSLMLGRRSERMQSTLPAADNRWLETATPIGVRKPRLAWGSDEGKVEPSARAFDTVNGRYGADAPNLQETMPIAPVDASVWSADRARTLAGHRDDEWLEIPGRRPANRFSRTTPDRLQRSLHCPACGESMTGDDIFCPGCGRARQPN